MPTLRVRLASGRDVEFSVAAPGDPAATVFVLGVHKCGSSLLNSLVNALATLNGAPYLDVAGTFFHADVPEKDWSRDPAVLALVVQGQVHGGFRAMAPVLTQSALWPGARKILMVRDPRDALVSEYFSTAYSHSLPAAEGEPDGVRAELLAARQAALSASVERFVLEQAPHMNHTMMGYAEVARDPRTRLFRYEDVILRKRAWLNDIAAHLGWSAGSEAYQTQVMGWADVVPTSERPDTFVRRVLPGDHTEKLGAGTIARLDAILEPAMRLFGYGG